MARIATATDTAVLAAPTPRVSMLDRLVGRLGVLTQYAAGAVVALGVVAGIARITDTGLPACDSARVERTLKAVLRAVPEGGTLGTRRGDSLVAFAIPSARR